jgi:hypothetical protein
MRRASSRNVGDGGRHPAIVGADGLGTLGAAAEQRGAAEPGHRLTQLRIGADEHGLERLHGLVQKRQWPDGGWPQGAAASDTSSADFVGIAWCSGEPVGFVGAHTLA